MSSVRSLSDLCARIVAHSRNSPLPKVPATPSDSRRFRVLSGMDTAIFTANGVAALTPSPGIAAVPTIIWGLGRIAFGLAGCCSPCGADATPGKRSMIAGAALVAGGAAAFVPVLGSKVNFALAAWSAAELAAASVLAHEQARVGVT